MAGSRKDNQEFELRGFNHLALVCRDMAETVEWYQSVLGMRLVKTLELPDGGQHFFLDMGNGVDAIAFFWFPDAPDPAPRPPIGSSNERTGVVRRGSSSVGATNHIAFDVPPELIDDYLVKLRAKGVAVTEITNHATSLGGGHKPGYDAATDDGDVFVRSLYFNDPNGVLLEFACWTAAFTDADVAHAPKTAADRTIAPLSTQPSPTR
jgi:catechol 2,3-dioxygenase-like lactoylglutathione lyase family enzyme